MKTDDKTIRFIDFCAGIEGAAWVSVAGICLPTVTKIVLRKKFTNMVVQTGLIFHLPKNHKQLKL